jgi:hypothetical protein
MINVPFLANLSFRRNIRVFKRKRFYSYDQHKKKENDKRIEIEKTKQKMTGEKTPD